MTKNTAVSNGGCRILSEAYERMRVVQHVNGEEINLLEINDASDTPITSSEDITVHLKPSEH